MNEMDIEAFREFLQKKSLSPGTVENYVRVIRHLLVYMNANGSSRKLRDASTIDLKRFMSVRSSQGATLCTLRGYQSTLRSFYDLLLKEKHIAHNPAADSVLD